MRDSRRRGRSAAGALPLLLLLAACISVAQGARAGLAAGGRLAGPARARRPPASFPCCLNAQQQQQQAASLEDDDR
jgi:hypothetical protein